MTAFGYAVTALGAQAAAMTEFAMYEGLRATRDADSCLAGLNTFRAGLRGDGGPAFLARYLRQSPE